jgi:hypothetical protein
MPNIGQQIITKLDAIGDAIGGDGFIKIPLLGCHLASTGVVLAVFADGASDTPGTQLTNSESLTIRWNNHAAPLAVGFNDALPLDLNPSYPLVFNAICSKTGATVGDATTLTVAFYNNAVGALHDADSNAGGATGAVTGDATAKTTARLQRTILAADLATPPGFFCLTFGPTAGTLGTDDFLVHAAWLSYTKRQAVS